MIATSPTDLMFRDVFFELRGFLPAGRLVLKLEGFHATGSIKMKAAIRLVEAAEISGQAERGRTTIIESSSGNLGVALSCVCAQRGYRFVCVTDPNINEANVRAIKAYGGEVRMITQPDEQGGYVGTRIAMIQEMLRVDPDALWLNQYANPANRQAHADETAREILAAFPAPDWLVVGVGTSGTLMGCIDRFRSASPGTRIVAVDPEGSVSFGGKPGPRFIPGIGGSQPPALLDPQAADVVLSVPESATIQSCHRIVREYGLLLGGSSGTAAAAAAMLQERISSNETVIAIAPDLGDRYLHTIYDEDWVAAHFPGISHEGAARRQVA